MEAIEKLRSIINWANAQSESINLQFKSIKGIEQAYDYANKHNLVFIDNDYLWNECTEEERPEHIKQINKFLKIS
jgi:hypothetical protein